MKAVLISIRPKWCKLIASGKKTVEVRKSKPKLDTPFKVYIYCTYGQDLIEFNDACYPNVLLDQRVSKEKTWGNCCNGKVIGKFICDKVAMSIPGYKDHIAGYWDLLDGSCQTVDELVDYGQWKFLYGWHISNLVIYDRPKELSEFFAPCIKNKYPYCFDCEHGLQADEQRPLDGLRHVDIPCGNYLKRPPQSWCYVEGLK